MTSVRFIYQGDDYNIEREKVSTHICQFLANILKLPIEIQIVFAKLPDSIYGNTIVNHRFKNRITINSMLAANEVPIVLIHELVHLQQITTGRLSNTSNGKFMWDKKIFNINDDTDHDMLPWELDVSDHLPKLIKQVQESLTINRFGYIIHV